MAPGVVRRTTECVLFPVLIFGGNLKTNQIILVRITNFFWREFEDKSNHFGAHYQFFGGGEFEDKTNHFGAHYQISMIQTGPESFGHISEL